MTCFMRLDFVIMEMGLESGSCSCGKHGAGLHFERNCRGLEHATNTPRTSRASACDIPRTKPPGC